MLAGFLGSVLGVAAIAMTCLVVRTVNRSAEETFRRVVTSPANEAMTGDVSRMTVGAVIALDDEMLIELRSVRGGRADRVRTETAMWLHSSTNVASIITLTRWRDARAVIDVRQLVHGIVLSNDQARVSLASARTDLTL
jgi:hypothetical protein